MTILLPNIGSRNILRNFIAGFLAAYGAISFVIFLLLDEKWSGLAPKLPNVALGLIYQHSNHGSYTYFSAFQTTACALVFITSILLFLVAVIVTPKKNIRSNAGKFSFRQRYDVDDPASIRLKAALLSALVTPIFVFVVGPNIVKILCSFGVVINLG